jgi:hypothetical protein
MYLLDTNHFSRLIQQDSVVRQRIAAVGEQNVVISIITAGEIYYMAYHSERRQSKIHHALTVVSKDQDFPRMQQVRDFSLESWF